MSPSAPDPADSLADDDPGDGTHGLLTGRDLTFVPGEPPRSGAFVVYDACGGTHTGTGGPGTMELVLPTGTGVRRRSVPVTRVPVARMLPLLLELDGAHGPTPPRPSVSAWAATVTAGLSLLARGRLLPAVTPGGYDAWRAGPLDPADLAMVEELADWFPASAHPLPMDGTHPLRLHTPAWLIRAAWDALADTLPRTPAAELATGGSLFAAVEPQPAGHLRTWLAEAGPGAEGGVGVSLRVELADAPQLTEASEHGDAPRLDPGSTPALPPCRPAARGVLQLTSRVDPSLVVDAADLFANPAAVPARFGQRAEEDLLLALRRGARAWPPLEPLVRESSPSVIDLDDDDLADLAGEGVAALCGAGIEVQWPAELLSTGLTLEASISSADPSPEEVADTTLADTTFAPTTFSLRTLIEFRWQVALDGVVLTADELDQLAEAKRGLVRLRGRWLMAEAGLLEKATATRTRPLGTAEALGSLLAGELEVDGELVPVKGDGPVAVLAGRLRDLAGRQRAPADPAADPGPADPAADPGPADDPLAGLAADLPAPPGLAGELRPYQQRGVAWLDQMCQLGLGGCLADDMGLGKTVQVIGLHLHRRARGAGPMLVVCPTSLLGNWERELQRFAPGVPVRRYHGAGRHLDDLAPDEVVIATYGVVRRDHRELADAGFALVVADEAQHAKNPASETARSLRAIPSAARIALSGTPVENRLTELWSILDWSTPGLLGPLRRFQRSVATPIERYRDPEATARLTRVIGPFLLRRRKTDPAIAPELPPRTVSDLPVPLTTEQATLYAAEVKEAMATIGERRGMARRASVLRLLTALKQICNHPAHYLHQPGPIAGRSGKLTALEELLDVVLAEGESVLVFSQFVEALSLIEARLAELGIGTLFLHGGVAAARRQELVTSFQAGQAPVFLLSLKAGGLGLNLTRATHVVHFDRWWNPAVEDQATDRAHRIGQDRPVQVHRIITEGTLEDRIADMLERKRGLADAVVGDGEVWLTELTDAQLAELVSLGGEDDR